MNSTKVFTVSQLNAHISNLISSDTELQTVFIEGEISNLNINSRSGHMYFSLKDKNSVIRAVMFSWAVKTLRFAPEDGMKVIMRAGVTVYEPGGQYQLRVEDMRPDGIGKLALQLEQLKKKLSAEGLFDPAHKKQIPEIPRVIGVITSPTGAVIRDIRDVVTRRFPCARIVLAPVLVQGDAAPAQLIQAVNLFSETKAADVIIIGRGGGSMEDLWAFNDEGLARAIYACKIPVISAVGHETDTTICDFVSDLRAPTPSAAAELAVPDKAELTESMTALFHRGTAVIESILELRENAAEQMTDIVLAHSPLPLVERTAELVDSYSPRVDSALENGLSLITAEAREVFTKCEALNPVAILNRGFSYITKDGVNVASVSEVNSGDVVDIVLKDGNIQAEVL